MTMDREALVERVARAMGDRLLREPSACRDAARAALAVIEPLVREDERRQIEQPLEGAALARALRTTGATP